MPTNPFAYSTLNTGGRDALLTEKIKHAIELRKTKAVINLPPPMLQYPTHKKRHSSVVTGSKYENVPDVSSMPPISGKRGAPKAKNPTRRKSRRLRTENPDITHLFHGAVRQAAKMTQQRRNKRASMGEYHDEDYDIPQTSDAYHDYEEYTGAINDYGDDGADEDAWGHNVMVRPMEQPYSLSMSDDGVYTAPGSYDATENEWHDAYHRAQYRPMPPAPPQGPPTHKSFQRPHHQSSYHSSRHKKPLHVHAPSKYTSNHALNLLKKEIIYESKRRPSTTSHKQRSTRKYSPRAVDPLTQYTMKKAEAREKRRNSSSVPPSDESVEELPSTLSAPQLAETIRIIINFCVVRPATIPQDNTSVNQSFHVDGIMVTPQDNFEVLVVNRRILNQATYHALPGAPLQFMQSPEEAVFKFMGQYLSNFNPSLKPVLPLHLVTVAANPDRDPVGHVISQVYALKTELGTNEELNAVPREDEDDEVETHSAFEFVPINRLLEGKDYVLALDHKNLLLQFLLWFRAYGKDLLL